MGFDHADASSAAQHLAGAGALVLLALAFAVGSVLWWRGILTYNRRVARSLFGRNRQPGTRSERIARVSGTALLATFALAVAIGAVYGFATL